MKHSRLRAAAMAAALFVLGTAYAAAQESLLWSFDYTDGYTPGGGLIFDAQGNLYGTAFYGGTYDDGAVFELSPQPDGSWTENVLYSFGKLANSADGEWPEYGVIRDAKGKLYGVTSRGGAYKYGVVFELTPGSDGSWAESVLLSFSSKTNSAFDANGGLAFDKHGNLYGALYGGGGPTNSGQIYELSPAADGKWTPSVVYNFKGQVDGDAAWPVGTPVFDKDGNFYIGTIGGPAQGDSGAIVEFTPAAGNTWTEKIVYSVPEAEGNTMIGSLAFDGVGNLFGAMSGGGSAHAGTVFGLAPGNAGWAEKFLYNFSANVDDGVFPTGGPAFDSLGNMYLNADGGRGDNGTVVRFKPETGDAFAESVVFAFPKGQLEGASPKGSLLVDADGNIYGAASMGGAYYTNGLDDPGVIFEIASPAAAPAPVFSHPAGVYKAAMNVAITDAVADAAIYYTKNGEAPKTSSDRYNGPIAVEENETLEAIAVAGGFTQSRIASAAYTFATAAPKLSPTPGKFPKFLKLTITDSTRGAAIFYTTNGDLPTTSSKKYGGPFNVTADETIRAIAEVKGWSQSADTSGNYTFAKTTSPVISPDGGSLPSATAVKITDAEADSAIYYTIDGSTPTSASKKYSGKFTLSANATVKAVAIAPEQPESAVVSAKFAVQ